MSCYPTKKPTYIKKYLNEWKIKKIYGTKRPDALDRKDIEDSAMKLRELYEKNEFKVDENEIQAIVDEIDDEYVAAFSRNYDRLLDLVKAKTPLKI